MKLLHRLLLVVASAAFFIVAAQAQNAGTVSNHAVAVGKGPGVSGFTSVAPGTTGVPLTSNGASSDPSFSAIAAAGIQSNAVTNTKINPGSSNTFKGSLNGTATSDIALTACTLSYQITRWISGTGWECGINPVLPSRAVAATLDLSAFNSVTTQGYARPGDGGGATFYKRNGAILTYSITSAGSCNNGTWIGIRLTGGTGSGAYGTLTVSGGVATNFSLQGANAQGVGYAVNDVLTVSNAGNVVCASYPTITVNSVGNAPFLDSAVNALSITTAGSGCTNGTYRGLTPQNTVTNGGGFGDRLQVTVDVSGGAVTATSFDAYGGGYRVGDRVNFVNPNTSVQIPGCVTQPVLEITGTDTARASFTDAGGTNWQIVTGGDVNVLQFGAVADYNWLMPNGDATDNGPAFRAALRYIAIGSGPADAHGYGGGTLYVPRGGYLICGGVVQYEYTTMRGAGFGATNLSQCNSDGATANLITQGSPTTTLGNFATNTWDMTLYGATSGTGALIYSNNNQSGDAVARVAIYGTTTNRPCLKYEIGYGGQSMYGIHNVLCVPVSGSPAFDLSGNYGFTITGQTMISSVLTTAIGFRFGDGGLAYVGNGVHCEGVVTNCFSVNGSGSSPPLVTIEGALGPAITNLIYLETGTPANRTTVINTKSNGSPCTVYNQGTATCVKTGDQLGLATY